MEQTSVSGGGFDDELHNSIVIFAEEKQLVDGNGGVGDHQHDEHKQVETKVASQNIAQDPPKKKGSERINGSLKSIKTGKEQTIHNGSGAGSTGRPNIIKTAAQNQSPSLSANKSADGTKKTMKSSPKKASDAASLSRHSMHMKTESLDSSADCSSAAAKTTTPQAAGHRKSISTGFSSRLEERAEKWKEFLKKMEEKIHAKEVENSSRQAKSKENQEAEIKQLRKSLTFKATPMPNFYQEPGPPRVELKKIAPTRAISPKLGRHKPSAAVIKTESAAEGNVTPTSTSSNLNSSRANGGTKDNIITTPKKPVQRSVSRLPSQKPSQNSGSEIITAKSKAAEPKQKIEKSAE